MTLFYNHWHIIMNLDLTEQDRSDINRVLVRFYLNRLSPAKIFYNLCFCLCSPQTTFERNFVSINRLESIDFFNRDIDRSTLESCLRPVRFYSRKSNFILDAKKHFPLINNIIQHNNNIIIMREILKKKVEGLGLKTTSHFLRNLGFNGDYAIIDTHILKFMGVKKKNISSRDYYRIEKDFCLIGRDKGLTGIELDMLVWKYYVGLDWDDFVY